MSDQELDLSAFDPDSFLATTFDQANDTDYTPVPEGEYFGAIVGTKFRTVDTRSGSRVILEISWNILEQEELKAQLEMEELVVRQSLWLDMDGPGQLSFGRNQNVQLGRLRKALDLNGAGFSFSDLMDQTASIKVQHRSGKDEQVFAEVKEVSAA